MATGDITVSFSADATFTISPASTASDTNLLAGVESNSVTVSACEDHLISGKITTGTSPTASRVIQIWAIAAIEDTPTWPDVFDGTGSAETATSANVLESCGRLLHTINTDSTSDRTYFMPPVSLRAAFGCLPKNYVLFIVHNSGAALNATGSNHAFYYTPVYRNVAA